ncbi:MAG: response regulator transcription factor [Candidatus Lustribacter sp.]|jgi:DNA-binding response OmpR family regulator
MSLVLPRATPASNAQAHTASILIVDPTSDLMESISDQLGTDGYEIQQAADGEQALLAFKLFRPDLILLETQLAKIPGLDVLREIRRISDVPTIIVTTRADEADRVVGLELGADDFLAKPCSPRELLARIAALLRRSRCECGNVRSLQATHGTQDTITIDRGRHQVLRGDELLNLTATEFRILDALASNSDQTLTRGQLLDMVGRDSAIFDRTLDKHVANLRKKIEINASHPRHLVTIFGVGYRFCP